MNTLNGNNKFCNDNERLNPLIHNPFILKSALGTISISILLIAPTNKTFVSGFIFLKPLAIARAGYICPPVPPPEKMSLNAFTENTYWVSIF